MTDAVIDVCRELVWLAAAAYAVLIIALVGVLFVLLVQGAFDEVRGRRG